MTEDPEHREVGVRRLEVEGFRSARHTVFSPQRLCALVGEARAGKSTLLEALRAVLDPFVFQALGHDADRSGITIVECGGKAGIPFFARIYKAVGVPFVALHDRDAPRGRQPIAAERHLNELIAELTRPEQTIVLVPDFEAVAGIKGHAHTPQRAWLRFTSLTADAIPEPLVRAVERSLALAQRERREGLAMSEPIP